MSESVVIDNLTDADTLSAFEEVANKTKRFSAS